MDVDSIGSPAQEFVRRRWMKYETAQRIVGNSKILCRITVGLFAQLELLILGGHKDPAILKTIRRCRRQSESLLTGNEAFFLYSVAHAQSFLDCAMAEVGVFQGSSARIICEAKRERPLHLFDTFSGLPQPGERDKRLLKRGRRDGVWNGQRILPAGWVRYVTTPTPAAPNGQYGAFWWLNCACAARRYRPAISRKRRTTSASASSPNCAHFCAIICSTRIGQPLREAARRLLTSTPRA